MQHFNDHYMLSEAYLYTLNSDIFLLRLSCCMSEPCKERCFVCNLTPYEPYKLFALPLHACTTTHRHSTIHTEGSLVIYWGLRQVQIVSCRNGRLSFTCCPVSPHCHLYTVHYSHPKSVGQVTAEQTCGPEKANCVVSPTFVTAQFRSISSHLTKGANSEPSW